ncbi:hypothetical protein DWUX_823 [Desulfovibrio diazotrophicus]|nr:hypothetical protein DWUX_823 [Desulfovibrio diazotrophicus]
MPKTSVLLYPVRKPARPEAAALSRVPQAAQGLQCAKAAACWPCCGAPCPNCQGIHPTPRQRGLFLLRARLDARQSVLYHMGA